MIGVFVKFHYGESFEEKAIRNLAETARVKFEAMPGLHSKAFTFSSAKREATNFYIWDSEDAAKAFFTDQLLERVAGLYGVRPSVDFVQIATLGEHPGDSDLSRAAIAKRIMYAWGTGDPEVLRFGARCPSLRSPAYRTCACYRRFPRGCEPRPSAWGATRRGCGSPLSQYFGTPTWPDC